MQLDETLIAAVMKFADGARTHYVYGTIHRYREAAKDGNEKGFRQAEAQLNVFVTHEVQRNLPDAWREALERLAADPRSNLLPEEERI